VSLGKVKRIIIDNFPVNQFSVTPEWRRRELQNPAFREILPESRPSIGTDMVSLVDDQCFDALRDLFSPGSGISLSYCGHRADYDVAFFEQVQIRFGRRSLCDHADNGISRAIRHITEHAQQPESGEFPGRLIAENLRWHDDQKAAATE